MGNNWPLTALAIAGALRRRAMVAALMSSSALAAPQQAVAAPVIGFIQGAVAAMAGTAVLGGTLAAAGFGAGLAAGALVNTAFGGVIGRVLLSVGLSYLAQQLAPKPSFPSPNDRLITIAQPVVFAETAYGRTRKGGFLAFTARAQGSDVVTGQPGKKRHYSIILAAHPIQGVVEHHLDDDVVEIAANGTVTTPPRDGYVRIRPFTGAPGQTADAELVDKFAEITTDFDFAGLAGGHLWLRQPDDDVWQTVIPTGTMPIWAPVIDGHNGIHDPRTGANGFTRNAALILAHWMAQATGRQVVFDNAEADACDELLQDRSGNIVRRWEINATISDDQNFEAQRTQLAIACDAFIFERRDGAIGFHVGRWIEPSVTLTDRDVWSIEIESGAYGDIAPSEVVVLYTEPAIGWREAPSAPRVLREGDRVVVDQTAAFAITNHNQAARLRDRLAKVKTAKWRAKITLGLKGYDLMEQRFFWLDHPITGARTAFEIDTLERREDGLSFEVTATAVEGDPWAFDAATDEGVPPPREQVTEDTDVPVVSGLAATADASAITWTWDAVADGSLITRLRYRQLGAAEWITLTVTGLSATTVNNLAGATTFEAQIRNQTPEGRLSAWAPATPLQTTTTV